MAISGISTYADAMYQWQSQQLKSTGASASNSATSTALNTLFGGSASMTSQIAGMVELTKYAMDQMGLSADSRVTFSQITKYREQLVDQFEQGVKKGIEESGISNLASLSYTLDSKGKITVFGGTDKDRQTAQAWLDANSSYGETLLKALPPGAFADQEQISFTLSSTGRMMAVNEAQDQLQGFLNGEASLADAMRAGLESAGIKAAYPIELAFDGSDLKAKGEGEEVEAINAWLAGNKEIEAAVKKQLEKQKTDASAVSLRLGGSGPLQATVKSAQLEDIQAGFDGAADTGAKMRDGLANLAIDKSISFSIQIADDGSLKIISDHPDAAKLQKFFDSNPELVKKYKQIETLAGIDDARKAMQISPSAMRSRIQIESMSSWWFDSGSASSYFGNYNNNSLSLLSGLNMKV